MILTLGIKCTPTWNRPEGDIRSCSSERDVWNAVNSTWTIGSHVSVDSLTSFLLSSLTWGELVNHRLVSIGCNPFSLVERVFPKRWEWRRASPSSWPTWWPWTSEVLSEKVSKWKTPRRSGRETWSSPRKSSPDRSRGSTKTPSPGPPSPAKGERKDVGLVSDPREVIVYKMRNRWGLFFF